jgi:SHS2 domain-containing protein
MKYRFLEHTADIKFIVYGKKMKDLFENSALAVSDFVSKSAGIKNMSEKRFKISGRDYLELLYNFIDEIIYFIDAENFVPCEAQVHIEEQKKDKIVLKAILFGDKVGNYENLSHIKAATYSEMYIKEDKEKKRWEAQAVIDV